MPINTALGRILEELEALRSWKRKYVLQVRGMFDGMFGGIFDGMFDGMADGMFD